MRIFIKAILLVVLLWGGLSIFDLMLMKGFGVLSLCIVGMATIAAAIEIWDYEPASSKEIISNKED